MILCGTHVVEVDCREKPARNGYGVGFLCDFGRQTWCLGFRGRLFVLTCWTAGPAGPVRWSFVRLRFDRDAITGIALQDAGEPLHHLQFCRVADETPGLVRLQRWVVRACRLRRGRELAACMGLHARLGARSPLAALDPDLFRGLVLRRAPRRALSGGVAQ
jgi:hypothetical protein